MKYPYLTLLLFSIFGIVDIAFLGNELGLDKNTWSGWVQAIGSIAALVVAIYVMSRQNKHARDLIIDTDKRALLRKTAAVGAVIDRNCKIVNGVCDQLIGATAPPNPAAFSAIVKLARQAMQQNKLALAGIPTFELGSYEIAKTVHQMIDMTANLESAMEAWETIDLLTIDPRVIVEGANDWKLHFNFCAEKYHSAVTSLANS